MTLIEVDALMEHLDSYRPSLKADIQNLTSLLSPLIEDLCLPDLDAGILMTIVF
jgi:hypothetical protein